jgi:hypothetical protein
MNISALRESKYLKKEDLPQPMLVTMADIKEINLAMEGGKPDMKYALYFEELDKPMVLNSTNGQLIAKIVGSDETDDWAGKQIVLYHEPNISFQGRLVGGIRVRAPRSTGYKPPQKGSAAAMETRPQEGDPDFNGEPF